MSGEPRSGCPINLTLEALGDRWSLLVIRDMMFGRRRHFQLVPLLAHMGAWGRRHTPATPELSIRAQLLEEGGPALWAEFMDELRAAHLGLPQPARGPTVGERLQKAYEAVRDSQGGAAA